MIALACQRWRARRDTYRPAGEPIDTSRYEVAAIADDRTAKAFVVAEHYSQSYPAARFRFGLYARGGALAGVAVVSHPPRESVLDALPGEGLERAELGRLVLLDSVPANGETWFLGRARLPRSLRGLPTAFRGDYKRAEMSINLREGDPVLTIQVDGDVRIGEPGCERREFVARGSGDVRAALAWLERQVPR